MEFRLWLQLTEALGPDNRWFCSQFYRQEVRDPEKLIRYYIEKGGAVDFARRYNQAMGELNRWYCSEFYRREISDPRILWEYYKNHLPPGAAGKDAPPRSDNPLDDMDMAG